MSTLVGEKSAKTLKWPHLEIGAFHFTNVDLMILKSDAN